ncbi:hypothetical protein C8R43DRAFT_957220 [Mycena crocata]|nr:hypothetical protein C8R43DRAFT_957220 [Mycena crocata]
MAPPTWANDEQKVWLHLWLADYIRRQAEHKLHLLWPALMEAWFRQYPEHIQLGLPAPNDPNGRRLTNDELKRVGTAIVVRKKQLESYMRYNGKKINNANRSLNAGGPILAALNRVLAPKHRTKRRRAHQAVEVFQKRFPDRIADALKETNYDEINEEAMSKLVDGWEEESPEAASARMKEAKSERMKVRQRVVHEVYNNASPNEREECEAVVGEEKEKIRAEDLEAEKSETNTAPGTRKATELQDGIDMLENVCSDVHRAIFSATGWVGMTLLGGANPRMGGELALKIICFGETPSGNDFEDVCVDFDKNIIEKFEAFLRTAITPEQRAAAAFTVREDGPTEPRVAREQAPLPAVPQPAKAATSKPKPKRMTKSKKSQTPAAAPTPPTLPVPVPAPLPVFAPEDPGPLISTPEAPQTPMAGSIYAEEAMDISDFDLHHFDVDGEDSQPQDTSTTPVFYPWPAGMPPPSSPATAATLALAERGGFFNGVMFIHCDYPATAPRSSCAASGCTGASA